MSFAYPIYFLLTAFIAGVILLYFFRKQYKEIIHPSNLLWQQVMNEWEASPWLKKLQQNLLFWLQIAALILLMLALARPYWQTEGLRSGHLIFIVDPSASMSASENGEIRFDKAKEKMAGMIERLQGQDVTVIKAGENPEVLINRENNRSALIKKINAIKLSYEHENIEGAIRLAESFSKGSTASFYIFSDNVKNEQLSSLDVHQYVEVYNFATSAGNISLTSFGVAEEAGKVAGLAVVENQTDRKKKFTFHIKDEGSVLFQKKLEIEPGVNRMIEIPELPRRPYYVSTIEVDDGYAVDNSMTAVLNETNQDVFTYGNINPFIIKGLQTIGVDSTQINDKANLEHINQGIIFSEAVKLDDVPRKPMLLINRGPQSDRRLLKEPILSEKDPLLEFVQLEKTFIKYAYKPVKGEWETLARSGDFPLIQKGTVNGQPVILLNFAIEDTDWPLHPGYPIFLYNSYQWLNQQADFLGYFQPGEEKWLSSDRGDGKWEIFSEKGESISSFDIKTESFKAPFRPGIYQAVSGNQVSYFCVVLDEREKKISKNSSFIMNKKDAEKKNTVEKQNDSIWFWFVFIVFWLLMLEWEVYRRGVGR